MDESKLLLKKNGKTIYWRKLSLKDENEVKRLAVDYFAKNEPIACSVIAPTAEIEGFHTELAMSTFKHNMSIGAYDAADSSKLCAVCLMMIHDPSSECYNFSDEPRSTLSIISRFLVASLEGVNEAVGNNKYMMIEVETTADEYCRMGIMTALQKKAEIIAKEHGCRHVAGVYTSNFTQRLSKNLGYKLITEIKYTDYIEPITKEKIYRELPGHTSSCLMVLDLETVQN